MKVKATINRITDKPESTVKAYASVSFDGAFAVHGIKVCENEKGRFVSMPSSSYKDRNGETKYNEIFHPISKGAREALNQSVLNAYDYKLQQMQNGNRDRRNSGRSRGSQGISRTGDRNVML